MNLRNKILKSIPPLAAVTNVTASKVTESQSPQAIDTPTAPAASGGAPKAKRPDILKGVTDLHIWLKEQATEILSLTVSEKTKEQYTRNGQRLDKERQEGNAVSLTKYEGKASTFYAYRAAVRYYAAKAGLDAINEYNKYKKSGNDIAAAAAWQRVIYAAADLKTFPKDAAPGLPSAGLVALGLSDPKQEGAAAIAKREGRGATTSRDTSKLKAANSIAKKYPDWRSRLWLRLVEIKSPWLDHTAIAGLTGARPEELRAATFSKEGNVLRVRIEGAKVSTEKGQPWRVFSLKNDGSHEFAHLFDKAGASWKVVNLPEGVTDYPDAFSAALARAGRQVLAGAERMSGYVYRHALASDLKADGFSREDIAAALGHAVTKTQDTYGRAVGGSSGKRALSVQCARQIKQTHDTKYANMANNYQAEKAAGTPAHLIMPNSSPATVTLSTSNFEGLGL
jgi:hypothetical protein